MGCNKGKLKRKEAQPDSTKKQSSRIHFQAPALIDKSRPGMDWHDWPEPSPSYCQTYLLSANVITYHYVFFPDISLQNFRPSIEAFIAIFLVCLFSWTRYSYHFEFFVFVFREVRSFG